MNYPRPDQKPSEEFHKIAFGHALAADRLIENAEELGNDKDALNVLINGAQVHATLAQAYATMALYRHYYRNT